MYGANAPIDEGKIWKLCGSFITHSKIYQSQGFVKRKRKDCHSSKRSFCASVSNFFVLWAINFHINHEAIKFCLWCVFKNEAGISTENSEFIIFMKNEDEDFFFHEITSIAKIILNVLATACVSLKWQNKSTWFIVCGMIKYMESFYWVRKYQMEQNMSKKIYT